MRKLRLRETRLADPGEDRSGGDAAAGGAGASAEAESEETSASARRSRISVAPLAEDALGSDQEDGGGAAEG